MDIKLLQSENLTIPEGKVYVKNVEGRNGTTITKYDGTAASIVDNNSDGDNDLAYVINQKAPINSPIFTGTPKAPTPSNNSNDTQIATTEFVNTAINSSISNITSAMVFKGTVGTGGTITTLPTVGSASLRTGDTYKVITAGKYPAYDANIEVQAGDTFIFDGASWVLIPSGDEPNGTVTSVDVTSDGSLTVSGGPITTSGTISIAHADTSNQNSVNNAGRTYIQSISLDTYGHVTNIASGTEAVVNTDDYVTTAAFGSGEDVKLTLTRKEGGTVDATIPKVSSTTSGIVPKGSAVPAQDKTTKFLREDGTWATPSYSDSAEEVIYNWLLTHKGLYVPGKQYRITDYKTTSTQSNTSVADNVFDIIVVADDERTLNENARAIPREGTTYFNDCNLAVWQIKYCLNNDTDRFAWADKTNGKGVIYYMKDEFGNEAPYDFKNILLSEAHSDSYTFNWTESGVNHDASITADKNCRSNVIKPTFDNGKLTIKQVTIYSSDSSFNSYNNIIESGSFSIILANDCSYNIVGYGCNGVEIKQKCSENIIGNGIGSIIIGKNSMSNKVFSSLTTLGEGCLYNTILGGATLGDSCSNNIIGRGCTSIVMGNNCKSNTIKNGCSNIKFGTSSATPDGYENIVVEEGNKYIRLAPSSGNPSLIPKNVLISLGTNNTTTWKDIVYSGTQDQETIYQAANKKIISV